MPFCSNCGEKVSEGVRFCPNCGAQIAKIPPREGTPSRKPAVGQRPGLLTIIAILHFAVAVPYVVVGILLTFTPGSSSAAAFGLFLTVIGVTSFGAGYGLMKALRWTRTIEIVVGAGFFVSGFVLLITNSLLLDALGVSAIILGGLALIYPGTKSARAYLFP